MKNKMREKLGQADEKNEKQGDKGCRRIHVKEE